MEQPASNNEGSQGRTASTVHRQGGPIDEEVEPSRPRDSIVSPKSSHPPTVDNQGGQQLRRKKKLGAASNPVPGSEEARSTDEARSNAPSGHKRKVKATEGSSKVVRSYMTPSACSHEPFIIRTADLFSRGRVTALRFSPKSQQ
jgi:hypothetical protein